MLAITKTMKEDAARLRALRHTLSTRNEYLVAAKSSVEVKRIGRDVKALGFQKRGPTAFSATTGDYYQWWDRIPLAVSDVTEKGGE